MFTKDQLIEMPLENERELYYLFKKDEPVTIFDIGCCDGISSIQYSKLFPNANIWAFEPLPQNVLLTKETFKEYDKPHFKIIQSALAEKIGTSKFYVSSGKPKDVNGNDNWNYGNKSSSLLSPGSKINLYTDWLEFKEEIIVETDTLENYCKKNNIPKIDFIHMDVQGAELLVLKGAGKFIRNIKSIWLEVEKEELYKNQPLKKDVEKFMSKNRFLLIKDNVIQVSGDQFYVNIKELNFTLLKIILKNYIKRVLNKIHYKL